MKKTKIMAFYLPQFHNVPENDVWWGKGFTEWTAVKAAEPYFDGHNQPRIPLDNHYYNLLDKETMKWQAEMAAQYGIDGFCFYHYYFKEGRKILERPAENLLQYWDFNMPFCFCWANESWITTWSNIKSGSVWASKFETGDRKSRSVLLEQQYGERREWAEHFEYLLPFFKDERYIRVEGKPVFLIYRTEEILCLDEMLKVWNAMAKEEGFPGIFCIGNMNRGEDLSYLNGIYEQEPAARMYQMVNQKEYAVHTCQVKQFDCSAFYKKILYNYYINSRSNYYPCTAVDFDNTPRFGTKGRMISNPGPDIFKEHLQNLLWLAEKKNSEFLFINAWNEWGEGMYLEPDSKWGYGYLEAVREAIQQPAAPDFEQMSLQMGKDYNYLQPREQKFREYFYLLHQWMKARENGIKISGYFERNKYHTIAIYGLGLLGEHLLEELDNENIKVAYVIDRVIKKNGKVKMQSIEEKLDKVDVIVVTPVVEFQSIRNALSVKCDYPILSLKNIVEELLGE